MELIWRKRFGPVVKPCFSAKRLSPLKSEEFKNQLKRQEDALNKMTVKEFKDARVLYLKNKRKGTGKVQKEARIQYEKKLLRALTKEHRKTKSPLDAATDAKNETTARMENLAALHEPDMIAGGKDIISDIGDRSVNSSIGSQWKNRVRFIDDAISDISQIDGENTKMNVKLENCK